MSDRPDLIEREVILPVPRERVWAALTRAEGLSAWFGTGATVDLRPGGALTFIWDGEDGTKASTSGVVEVVEPLERFAFHWHSIEPEAVSMASRPTTRVEFTLADHPDGTLLRLVESGFARIPRESGPWSRDRHLEGWQRELGDLARHLQGNPTT